MTEYAKNFPEWAFEKHKGYPTKKHIESIEQLGVTVIHRRTFSPVKKIIDKSC